MHTRNALYGDQTLPVGKDEALPTLRQKRQRDGAGYMPAAGAVHPAMLASLQTMASAETTVVNISDIASDMCESLERHMHPKLTLSDVTTLPSITEAAEPKSPQPAPCSPAPPKPKIGIGRRNPLTRIAKSTRGFAKLSPSPNRDRAKRMGHSPLPSTPTRILFPSSRRPHLSPSKGESPISKGSPLRVFTSVEPEPVTPTTVEAQREESSNLQRARPARSRLSIASQLKVSMIVDEKPGEEEKPAVEEKPAKEEKVTDIDSALEDSVAQQTKGQNLRSLDVDFGEKTKRRVSEPIRMWSTPELSVDARTNLDIFGKSLNAVNSLARAAEGFSAAAVDESHVTVEKTGGRLVVRFKLPAAYADHFTMTEIPTTEKQSSPAVEEDASTAAIDNGDRTLNIWETPVKAPPSATTTPRITLTQPDDAEVEDASFMSTDTDALVGGLPDTPTAVIRNDNNTPVRAPMVKEPETPAMTPSANERAVTPLSTAIDNIASANDTEHVSRMANSTDALIGSLPDTPTAIVLGGIQTPRPVSITPFSKPGAPGSAVSSASVMSTDTDALVAGLPDTPTTVVLGAGPETPRNRGPTDEYDGDYSDLYTPVADQTLAVDIPSSWVARSSPMQSEQGDNDASSNNAKPSENTPRSNSNILGPVTVQDDTVEHSSTHNSESPLTPDAGNKASITSALDKDATKESDEHAHDATDTATPKELTEIATNENDEKRLETVALEDDEGPVAQIGLSSESVEFSETSEVNINELSTQEHEVANAPKDGQVGEVEMSSDDVVTEPASELHIGGGVEKGSEMQPATVSDDSPTPEVEDVHSTTAKQDFEPDIQDVAEESTAAPPPSSNEGHTQSVMDKQLMDETSEISTPQANDLAADSDALTSPPATPETPDHFANDAAANTPSPKNSQSPATLDTLLESPFHPSCAGTPKPTTPPSRALGHQVAPCEPRESGGAAQAAGHKANFAETQEAANRAYLGKFLTQHKASKAARSAVQEASVLEAASMGSPKPRVPLGQIDANTASPMKAGAKRKAEDAEEEETAEVAKPPMKRGKKASALKPTAPEPLRRSSRVKAKAQDPTENSKIPVRVGSNVFEGAAAGGETKEADVASVTKANTRRNKGKAILPAEYLARRNQDPTAYRMQELKEVHDARAARAGKARGKGIQWGENTELIFDPEDDEEEEVEEAPAKKGREKKGERKSGPKKAKGAEKPVKKASVKKAELKTGPATPKARPATPRPATPMKRQTRSSTRQKQATGGL